MNNRWIVLVKRWLSVNLLTSGDKTLSGQSQRQKLIFKDGINVCLVVTGGISVTPKGLKRPRQLAESCLMDSLFKKKEINKWLMIQNKPKSMLLPILLSIFFVVGNNFLMRIPRPVSLVQMKWSDRCRAQRLNCVETKQKKNKQMLTTSTSN